MNIERAVLGGMMLSRDALQECLEILTGADFADARHELIFEACSRLHDQNRPVDALTVDDALGADRGRVGAPALLLELTAECAVPASAGYYAQRVLEAAKLRRIGAVGLRLQQLATADAGDADEAVEQARAELDSLTTQNGAPLHLADVVSQAIDAAQQVDGQPTGWRELDELVYGWEPGRLYVVGARPGVGKSVIGCCAALSVARQGQAAVIMSAEMSRIEVAQRLIAAAGEVSMARILHHRLRDEDWAAIASARGVLDTLPIVIDDRPSMRVSDVASVARSVARRRPLGLVVVDYVQMLAPPTHLTKRSREEQVSYLARSLKNLAKQLHVPVLALAQLNRASQQRSDKRPVMGDLRESGELEQAADVVMLLHRAPDDSDDPDNPPDDLTVMIPKNRQGTTGGFTLHWQGDYARAVSRRSGL